MTEVVYRSTHPDVLAHMERHRLAFQAWRDGVRAALVTLGFNPDDHIWMTDTEFTGIVRALGDPVPDGWRRDRTADEYVIVPARRTKLGKQHGQVLDRLTQPDPRRSMPGGMPKHAMAKGEMTGLTGGFRKIDDAAYVTWSRELRDGDAARIDPTIWERLKLSEYHAACEAVADES
jgi:hypothetical protein